MRKAEVLFWCVFAALWWQGSFGSPVAAAGKTGVRIVPAATAKMEYRNYSDPGGCFTVQLPPGWKAKVGLFGRPADFISYAVTFYDSKSPDRQVHLNLNNSGMTKSASARGWYRANYPGSPQAALPALNKLSTAGYYAAMQELHGFKKFTVMQNLGRTPLGGDVLVARCVSAPTGKTLEGLFTATVTANSYPVKLKPFDFRSTAMIDAGIVTNYVIVMEAAPQEEFVDWQPVLDHILSSFRFTAAFHRRRAEQWRQVMGTARYIAHNTDQIGDMLMDSWKRRNATDDILSQKRSDATLGYERVYDVETKEIYKAPNGFMEHYDGLRYKAIDDSQYAKPIAGYIE